MVAEFPHWEVQYDANGAMTNGPEVDEFISAVSERGLSDLLVFSHGWNNTPEHARTLYDRFFDELRGALDASRARADTTIGTLGVVWPSMRWPDEPAPGRDAGGAAGLTAAGPLRDADLVAELNAVYVEPAQRAALDELGRLLDERPRDPQALRRFQQLLTPLAPAPAGAAADRDQDGVGGDSVDAPLLSEDPETLYLRFGEQAVGAFEEGGAAAPGDVFRRLWDGAREVLRQTTYWQMKHRAGVIGRGGLGPLLARLHTARPTLRLHLIGHSFGARLVSFALAGLPADATGSASPVKSLLLLQGAFSHFAFADALPHEPQRSGALAGMTARVDGPLVASYSSFDTAVGNLYPLASLAAGQDAADSADQLYRWGAIGHDGAQAVGATEDRIRALGKDYPFVAGKFTNVDCARVIRDGDPPSGAHSDILHPELGWLAASVAGLVEVGR